MGLGPLLGRTSCGFRPPLWEDYLKWFQLFNMADLHHSNLPMKIDGRTAHVFRRLLLEDSLWVQAPSLGGLPKMVSGLLHGRSSPEQPTHKERWEDCPWV